jgi:hypothetical protein
MLDVAMGMVCVSILFFPNFRTISCKVYGYMDRYGVSINLISF